MFFNLSFPLEQVNEVLNQIVLLRDHVHNSCDALCRAAVQGDVGELHSAMGALQDKASILIDYFSFCYNKQCAYVLGRGKH